MSLLKDKVAAITGGVTGIGRAIALEFVKQGAYVAINHIDDNSSDLSFKQMADSLEFSGANITSKRLLSVPGDIRDPNTGKRLVQETVKTFGRIDVLVSNAGICEFADFLSYAFQESFIIVSTDSKIYI
jgi:L-rhamnose 1-dehydrogenase